MVKVALTAMVLGVALFASGCGGDKESASRGISGGGGRSSSWSRKGASDKPESTMAMKAAKSDQGGELVKGPEDSMKRDLERLKSKERDQDKKVKDLRKSLSEGETLLTKEEGVLRDIRSNINDYHDALDKFAGAGSRNRRLLDGEEVVYQPENDRQASIGRERGRREANDDYDDRANYASDGSAYPKASVSGIPQPTHRNRSDFESANFAPPRSPFRGDDSLMNNTQPARRTQYPDPMPAPVQTSKRQPATPTRRDLSPEPAYAPVYQDEQTAASVPPAEVSKREQETEMGQVDYQDASSDIFVPDLYLGGN